jgi:sarcosine oxidase subunit beta
VRDTADVVIIGGGCMGASVAHYLARRGITDVVLLERESTLGAGSTGRNAGGVRHQFSTEANIRLSIESISLFERFHDEIGCEIDFHQDGYLFLISSESSLAEFEHSVALQRRLGVPVDLISPGEAASLAPGLETDGIIAATFCGRDGICDPNGVTMGFAQSARAAGVEILRETEVTGVKLDRGTIAAVETNRGPISTRTVVNAAGPHSRVIGEMIGVDIPIDPYRRHIFITGPIADKRPKMGRTHRVPPNHIMVIDFETSFYFHREGAGVLYGMSDPDEQPGYELTVNWEFLERLTPVATRRLPALAETSIAHAWAGLYEVTPDAMPIIGPVRSVPGFYIIGGFSGHGFQHCPAAGRILAEMIAADSPPGGFDPAPFAFARFDRGAGHTEYNVV